MNEFDYLAEAKTNMEIADYSAVISLCDKALKINKNLPEAYSFRGNAKYELEEYDEAVVTSGASTPYVITNEIVKYLENYDAKKPAISKIDDASLL